ncbi:MAG: hypothetical protein OEW19_21005 [Acidobacteriota bacterium]|nr:hypothetical protein [Acidobacteriota bacterium]
MRGTLIAAVAVIGLGAPTTFAQEGSPTREPRARALTPASS